MLFSKKNDGDIYEYVFTKGHLKKFLFRYFLIWFVLRLIRFILLLTIGFSFITSPWYILLVFMSGIPFGLAIHAIVFYKMSVHIENGVPTHPVEGEKKGGKRWI